MRRLRTMTSRRLSVLVGVVAALGDRRRHRPGRAQRRRADPGAQAAGPRAARRLPRPRREGHRGARDLRQQPAALGHAARGHRLAARRRRRGPPVAARRRARAPGAAVRRRRRADRGRRGARQRDRQRVEHRLPHDAARGAQGRARQAGRRAAHAERDPHRAGSPLARLDRLGRPADQHRRRAELHRAPLPEGRRRPAGRGRARLGRRPRGAAARRGLRPGQGRPGARARGRRDRLPLHRAGRRPGRTRRPAPAWSTSTRA